MKNPTPANPAPPEPPNVEMVRSAGYRQTYANSVALRTTNWDVFLDFGKIVSASEKGLSVETEVGVYLSPQQAKALSKVLAKTISDYEKQFGEIQTEAK